MGYIVKSKLFCDDPVIQMNTVSLFCCPSLRSRLPIFSSWKPVVLAEWRLYSYLERLYFWGGGGAPSNFISCVAVSMQPFYMPVFRLAVRKNTHSAEYFKACNKTIFYGREQGNVYKPVRFWWVKIFIAVLSQGINVRSDNYLWPVGPELLLLIDAFSVFVGCAFALQF